MLFFLAAFLFLAGVAVPPGILWIILCNFLGTSWWRFVIYAPCTIAYSMLIMSVLGGQSAVPGRCKQHGFYFSICLDCVDAEDAALSKSM